MTRRDTARKVKANPTPAGGRDIVRQAELREVLDLYHRAELCAEDICRRLEAGSRFERGGLGVSTYDAEDAIDCPTSLELNGIRIATGESHIELRTKFPRIAPKVWA